MEGAKSLGVDQRSSYVLLMARVLQSPVVMQVAAALAARHIGGAVNYVAVAEATGMSASAQAAGLAADNLVRQCCAPSWYLSRSTL